MHPEDGPYRFSFRRTRTDSIKEFMKVWDENITNWKKEKRQGYKCVKATLTIEVEPETKDYGSRN